MAKKTTALGSDGPWQSVATQLVARITPRSLAAPESTSLDFFTHHVISAGLVFLCEVSLVPGFPLQGFTCPAHGFHTTAGVPARPLSRLCTDLLLKSRQLQRCLCCLMRGTMQEGGPASLRNGCLNSSCAVALCEGSRTSIESRKPRRTEETWNITLVLGADKDTHFQPTLGLCTLLFLGRQGTHWAVLQQQMYWAEGPCLFYVPLMLKLFGCISGVQNSTHCIALHVVGEKSINIRWELRSDF